MLEFSVGVVIALMAAGVVWYYRLRSDEEFLQYLIDTLHAVGDGRFHTRVYMYGRRQQRELIQALNHMSSALGEQVEQLSQERDVLQHILQNMTTGVVYVARDGHIRMMNQAAERMFRRPAEQCIDREHWAVFRQYHLGGSIESVMTTGEARKDHLKLADGFEVDVELIPMHARRSEGARRGKQDILMLCNDVSDWRRLERMRSEFVANVSHELKTPIAAIRGFAETMLDGDVDEESREMFNQTIYDEAKRMGNLVTDLLELSKLEAAQHGIQPASVSLNATIHKALQRLQGEAAKRRIAVEAVACDATVWADEDKILQVLLNLVANAIHYTPEEGYVRIWCEIFIDRVKIHVTDTGMGIPPEHQSRVFERFYRVHRDRSRSSGGTGLGLAIVKHIVNAHGGEAGLTSEPGKGSDFWFTLSRLGHESNVPNPVTE